MHMRENFTMARENNDDQEKVTEIYKQYSGIMFYIAVMIENSENPPRGIALGRKDASSVWEVLGEGH
jgi:hypothetical protein